MYPEQLISKYDALKASRKVWESHWQEVADYILPRKNDITRSATAGEKKGFTLFDSTGPHSNELLASSLQGILTNPATIWFELITGDPAIDDLDDVRRWLQKQTRSMHRILNNSNFQTEIHEVYLDLGAFGTGVLSIEEDDDKVVRFAARPLGEVCVDENNKGVIDCVYRCFKWNAKQIVAEFGLENVGRAVKQAYEKSSNDLFEIIHAVYPRSDEEKAKGRKASAETFPFASVYVLKQDKHTLKTSGFREFPYAIPRWTKVSGEIYGRSAGMTALPDIKLVNEMMKTILKGAQKTVDPPLMMPDDGVILPLKTQPGGLNYYRAGLQDPIKAFGADCRIDFGYQVMEDVRKRIRDAFYIDQLQMAQGPQMTATEVLQRTEEKSRLLGPVLGRQHSELLRPLIDRVFGIMLRRGLINPQEIPQVLRGRELDVEYSSLIAKSQRVTEGQAIMRTLEASKFFVNADPKTLDNFDGDSAVKHIARIFGAPQEMLRDGVDVQKLRKGRDEANEASIAQQQAAATADAMGKVMPAMAKAKEAGMV